jgi:hypothetical protein
MLGKARLYFFIFSYMDLGKMRGIEMGNPVEKTEQELTLELIKIIMNKVCDINEKGIAFHSLHADKMAMPVKENREEKLPSVLRSGIVGVTSTKAEVSDNKVRMKSAKDHFVDFIRSGIRPDVYFNITGRTNGVNYRDGIKANFIIFHEKEDTVAIIFNLDPFKEVPHDYSDELPSLTYSNNSQCVYPKNNSEASSGRKGELNLSSSPDYGFRLASRVPPRFFKGILIHIGEDRFNDKELYFSKLQSKLKEVVEQMHEVNRGRTKYLLPIYDSYGDLLWPKHMSHKDVQNFVASRDAKNTEELEKA